MATKNHCLQLNGTHDLHIVGTISNRRYDNLNLNGKHQILSVESVHSNDFLKKSKKVQNYEKTAASPQLSDVTQRSKFSRSWKKSENSFPSKYLTLHSDSDKNESKKGKELSKSKNDSTLSLHIAAYENSVEAESNSFEGIIRSKEKSSNSFKSSKNVKHQNFSSAINNPFEFPRQQTNDLNDPAVMQFTASQKLLNPNQSDLSYNNQGIQNIAGVRPVLAHYNQRLPLQPAEYLGTNSDMKRSSAALDNDGFLHPDNSHRRGTGHFVPVSPDMKNARNRLGNLLSGIRKGDIGTFGGDKDDELDSDQGFKKGPGRPKRSKRERRIIYELRNKVFSVRDSYAIEPIYPMMRKWLYGCDDDLPPTSDELPASPNADAAGLPGSSSMISEDSLDLLATKEIHKMPEPLPISDDTLPPMKIFATLENPIPEGSSIKELLKEHASAWRDCKKQHKKYMELRELKYEPSLKLLKTVYAITQQANQ